MGINFKKLKPSVILIAIYFVVIPFMNFNHHNYERDEGVIAWDIKSYYAYLPAAFIYHDIELGFMGENPQKFNKWIWPVKTPTGKLCILTTMGMSVMYSPFFLIAHQYAKVSGKYEADGYSKPYHVALTFSAWVYFIIALLFLRSLLLRYYSERSTTITLLAIAAGTNLMHYLTYEAPMSHAYSFTLIVVFLYYLDLWCQKMSWRQTILLGVLSGLITLIRPTNIIVLLLVLLWRVNSLKTFQERIKGLLSNWMQIVVMAIVFVLVWLPQFFYWYKVSGMVFYFSYGEVGSAFYFNNPQILDVLFSYKKGLFIYTPVIFIATLSIYFLFKQKSKNSIAILIFFIVNLYILSSWWSWWFGGGYSIRAYIDSYGLMAFPLAALIEHYKNKKVIQFSLISFIILLTAHNEFQMQQYRKLSIHYWWMNKEAYWDSFLRLRPSCKHWNILLQPNVEKARKGIYEEIPFKDSKISRQDLFNKIYLTTSSDSALIDSLKNSAVQLNSNYETERSKYINEYIDKGLARNEYKELRIEYLKTQMQECESWKKEIEKLAKRRNVSVDEIMNSEANRIFEKYAPKYIN
jgi:hypothetical protein